MTRPDGPGRAQRAVVTMVALIAASTLAGCGRADDGAISGSAAAAAAGPSEAPSASVGRTAPSQRVRFEPRLVRLPGGASAPVRPARTVDGELRVPEDVARVGWWDGGAYAGDPFGHTVLAGHVDSATQGLGFFARLLALRPGARLVVSGGGHRAAYRVVSVHAVDKEALALSSDAFDQRGQHRLVLITCTGSYDPVRQAYSQNLVVTAAPVGRAR